MTENLVVCSKCGTINRLPPSRPALAARCGNCKANVFDGHPEDADAEIFDRQIARSTIPVLVRCLSTLVRTMSHDGASLRGCCP